jgi:hypothetical protein
MPEIVGIASLLVALNVCGRAAATELCGAAGSTASVGASPTDGTRSAASNADAGANGADDEGAGGAITPLSAEPVGGTSFMN